MTANDLLDRIKHLNALYNSGDSEVVVATVFKPNELHVYSARILGVKYDLDDRQYILFVDTADE